MPVPGAAAPVRSPARRRAAAALTAVLLVLALRAAWREAKAKGRAPETPAAERLAAVVAAVPPTGRLGFADLGGDVDFQGRARIDLRLALAPRVLVDAVPGRADDVVLLGWEDDAATLQARLAARGLTIRRRLPAGYLLLGRDGP